MYDAKKESLMHMAHLTIVGIVCLLSIFTVFYPRSSEHDPKAYKQMKEEYEKYYKELPVLTWNLHGKSVGAKSKAAGSEPEPEMTGASEQIRIAVIGYADGFVKGDFIRYSTERFRGKPIVRLLETVPFKMADTDMPPLVKAELRKFRIGNSIDRLPESGVLEFQRYLAMKVELLRGRHIRAEGAVDIVGDSEREYGLYRHQKAFVCIVALTVAFGVWWRQYTSPASSFYEMKALMDEAGRIRYEYAMS